MSFSNFIKRWCFMSESKTVMPEADSALPGRDEKMPISGSHFVTGNSLEADVPEGLEEARFGLGCFWGAERKFWTLPGVYCTAVGYEGGYTNNPSYEEICTGKTGHAEVVRVIYDPRIISYAELLKVFWESHDPTQGMRQGNDVGTQYRSVIFACSKDQLETALRSKDIFQVALRKAGLNKLITTDVSECQTFFFAEMFHQQYLAKNPEGYCGLGGTGVTCPLESSLEVG